MAKSMLREKFIALNIYIRKKQKSEFSNLSYHLKNLEKSLINPKQAEGRKW